MMARREWFWHAGSVAMAIGFGLLWATASSQGWVSRIFLPTPAAAWSALQKGITHGDLLNLMLGTVERMAYGWVLASLAGIAIGAAIGVSAIARAWVQPMLEFMRPLPASSILPVAIVLFGLSPGMVLAVVAFGSMWPVLLSTAHGVAAVQPRILEVSRLLGMSRAAYIFKIGLPNAMPDAFAGMRVSMTVALILAVVGEMLASQEGLGTAILLAARSFHSAELFAGVILLGIIGFVSNVLLQCCERRVLRWRS